MWHIFYLLVTILFWPYQQSKKTREESTLGNTEFNRKATLFWLWFGIIGTLIVVVIVALIIHAVLK
jgi:hypothetical protein